MKKGIKLSLFIFMVLSMLLFSACGSGTESSSSVSQGEANNGQNSNVSQKKESDRPAEKVKLKVALPSKMFLNLPEFVAQKKGFYEEENLEVEFMHIADSSVPVKNLIAGEVDIAYTGTSETLAAASKGAKLKVLGGVNLGLHYGFYAGANSGIEDVKDLLGKKVAVSSPGSLPHVTILALLNKAGITNKEEIDTITWVPISGSSARIQGVITGKVDATVSSYNPEALQDPNIEMLFVVPERLPEFLMTSWDTTDKVIETKRDAIKRFIKAELKAIRYIMENKDDALTVAKEVLEKTDDKTLNDYYEFYTTKNIWRVNGETTPETINFMQKLNEENGIQDKVLPPEEVFDGSLVNEVLEEVGRK